MPYILHNSHKTILLQITPKLTARYIHDFYKATHNTQILTTPSVVLYILHVSSILFNSILYFFIQCIIF